MKTDIDCLKNLNITQLDQIRVFVETLGYRKAAVRVSKEFDRPIHKTALQRFIRRAAPAEFLDDSPENDEATRQILKFAADGQPDFTSSTVRTLEQQAFQLSLTCVAIEDDMNALSKVTTMLCRYRNAAVRERMAVVQENKLKLRQEELEKASTDNTDAKIQILNEKIAYAFRHHPVLTAIRNAEEASYPPTPTPNPNLNPTPTPPADSDTDSSSVPPKTKNSDPAPFSETSSESLSNSPAESAPDSSLSHEFSSPAPPQCQIENAQCSMPNEKLPKNPLQSEASAPSAVNSLPLKPQSLESRVNAYTLSRHHESLHAKDPTKVGKWSALNFKSQLQHCPCGNELPCPDHGNFPTWFWELSPDHPDYIQCLKQKNLPYTAPNLLIQEQLKCEKREQAFKNFPLDPETLRRSSADHAIRRWRSYTLRPPGTPSPDDSWNEECPCGAKLPCDHHDDLWREVRYLKPSDPDYAAALTRHGVPVYIPTPQDSKPSSEPLPVLHPALRNCDEEGSLRVGRSKPESEINGPLSESSASSAVNSLLLNPSRIPQSLHASHFTERE